MSGILTININLGNDAFELEPRYEVVKLLRSLANRIERYDMPDHDKGYTLLDSNGNEAGKAVAAHCQEQDGSPEEMGALVIQEGGATGELYLHSFNSIEEANDYRIHCRDDGAFNTSKPVEVPKFLLDVMDEIGATQVIQEILDEVDNLGVP